MGKQEFDRIKKTMAFLLAVLFLVSVTAAAVSARDGHGKHWQKSYGHHKSKNNNEHNSKYNEGT